MGVDFVGAESGRVKTIRAFLTDGNEIMAVDANKLAFMHKHLPTAELKLAESTKSGKVKDWTIRPVSFVVNGENKGLLMPMSLGDAVIPQAIIDNAVKQTQEAIDNVEIEEVETAQTKEYYQMTRDEFVESYPYTDGTLNSERKSLLDLKEFGLEHGVSNESVYNQKIEEFEQTIDNTRKAVVRQALSEGKQVPAEVLKDYPDLQSTETQETEDRVVAQKTISSDESLLSDKELISKIKATPVQERDSSIYFKEYKKRGLNKIGATSVKAKEVKENLSGFETTLSPALASKAISQMNQYRIINGISQTRKQYIEKAVSDGATVEVKEGQNALVYPDGRYILQSAITKTALDYANYLIDTQAETKQQAEPGWGPGSPKWTEFFKNPEKEHDWIKKELTNYIIKNVPLEARGKLLIQVRDAKTMDDLDDAIKKANEITSEYNERWILNDEAFYKDTIESVKDYYENKIGEKALSQRKLIVLIKALVPTEARGKLLDKVKNVNSLSQFNEIRSQIEQYANNYKAKQLKAEIKKALDKAKTKKE